MSRSEPAPGGAATRGAFVARYGLAVYALITATAALSTFLAIPILVRILGLEGFGAWSLVEPLVFFGTMLALFGAEHGVMKQVAHDGGDVREVVGELLPPSVVAIALAACVTFAAALVIAGSVRTAGLVAALAAVEGVLAFLMVAARASGRILGFAIGQIGRTTLFLAALVLVLVLPFVAVAGLDEVLAIRLAVLAAVAAVVLVVLRPRWGFSFGRFRDAVIYGYGILVTSLLTFLLDVADRYALQFFSDTEAVGAYVVHVKVAALVGQGLLMPFMLWFPTERFRHLRDADGGERFFRATAEIFLLALVFVCGGVYLAGPIVVALLAPEVAFDPWVLGLILVATAVIGMTHPLNVGLLQPGETHKNVYTILVGLAVLALTIVPATAAFGASGAAAARLAGSIGFLLAVIVLSERSYRIGFNLARMALIAAAGILLVVSIDVAVPGATLLAAAIRCVLFTLVVTVAAAVVLAAAPQAAPLRARIGLRA